MDFGSMVVAIVFMSLGAETVHRWMKYRMRLAEMRMQAPSHASAGLQTEIESLRNEIRQLRDTTMQYDMSFDTALQRMEGRVEALERRTYGSDSGAASEARLRT